MKFHNIVLYVILVLTITACNNKNEVDSKNEQKNFEIQVNDVVGIINENDISNYQNEYITYYIDNDYLYGINYNTVTLNYESNLSYDLPDYDFNEGIIVKKNDGTMYLSIESDDFCAIKDFNDSSFVVYNTDEKEKCHKLYTIDDEIKINVFATNLEDSSENYGIYESGTISNGYIKLSSSTNLIDELAVNYQWYRNSEQLDDGNVMDYTIISDYEDADYYVEVTAPDGTSYKSETVNVKIERAN